MHANDLTQRALPGAITRIVVPTQALEGGGSHFQGIMEERIVELAGGFTCWQSYGAWRGPGGGVQYETSHTYEIGGLDAAALASVLKFILENTGERAVYFTVGTQASEAALQAHTQPPVFVDRREPQGYTLDGQPLAARLQSSALTLHDM